MVEQERVYGDELVEQQIINLLTEYPKLSRTMIASHIAPYSSAHGVDWRLILDTLIQQGIVIATQQRTRGRTTTNYQLA